MAANDAIEPEVFVDAGIEHAWYTTLSGWPDVRRRAHNPDVAGWGRQLERLRLEAERVAAR